MARNRTSVVFLLILMLLGISESFPMVKLPWSFTVSVCLPMTDPSYDPFNSLVDDDVSEELRPGGFGSDTLFCKRGCCGDNRNPKCCDPSDDVDKGQFETYKLICVIAAAVGGLAIIGAITLALVKNHLKKRRLIRDIQAINQMNNMKGLAPDINKAKDKNKKSKKPKVTKVKIESPPQVLSPIKQSPPALKPVESLPVPPPPPSIYDNITPTVPQTSGKLPSYPGLNLSNYMDSNPTKPVGNLPLFLPTSLEPSAAPMMTSKPEVPKPLVFSTPLAGDPVIHSGPVNKSPETTSNKSSSGSISTSSTMPGSPLPWDDDDLLLCFSAPMTQEKPYRVGY